MSDFQMSDLMGATLMLEALPLDILPLDTLPSAKAMLGDRGYDGGWFRNALTKRGIIACIPAKPNAKLPIPHNVTLYRSATNSMSCSAGSMTGGATIPATTAAHTPSCPPPMFAIATTIIAATVIFWLGQ